MSVPLYKKAVLNYDFVGANNRSNYFEGWYLKCTLKDKTIALIPSLHVEKGLMTGHLQWIVSQGDRLFSGSQSYSNEETILSSNPFYLRLGENSFSETGFNVNEENLIISAQFQEITPYPKVSWDHLVSLRIYLVSMGYRLLMVGLILPQRIHFSTEASVALFIVKKTEGRPSQNAISGCTAIFQKKKLRFSSLLP